MANLNIMQLLSLALVLTASTSVTASASASASAVKAIYWMDQPLFPASSINTSLFTHVYYAFLAPNATTFKLYVSNSTNTTLTNFITTFRTRIPTVTTILSIGTSNATSFSLIFSNITTRATFINSTITVARAYGFDGVDLDWEFPQNSDDTNNLASLFQEWRVAITTNAAITGKPPLLLTAAVYFAVYFSISDTPWTYPVTSINHNVDWVNVMSYNFHGSWNNDTGSPSGLFNPTRNISVVDGLKSWIGAGVKPEKLVMGMPLYGMTWQLQDPNVNGIGAPVIGPGPGSNGAMAYFQVIDFNKQKNAKVIYDVDTMSVYSYSGSYWIGYDDPLTVTAKVGYAQALSLRGYFFWAAGYDTNDWKISTQASKAWILT
ncbi:hypothetical protein TanjilG_26202 [Lupinus angustifolius]|uniref:GH18 domain-containing protein n=1 Tax=Lupinus angustifolius TaxID=3871 RepID=A0A4P1R2H0_LUPAN|nr:PREDICTED: chitinase-3-like protein 1 [Lupinus angustifolius]OIV99864.1 hypothetical protein TanjilG_26202 [Lupinus angustifolius]